MCAETTCICVLYTDFKLHFPKSLCIILFIYPVKDFFGRTYHMRAGKLAVISLAARPGGQKKNITDFCPVHSNIDSHIDVFLWLRQQGS